LSTKLNRRCCQQS